MNTSKHCQTSVLVISLLGVIGILLSAGVLILTYYDKKIDGGLFTLAGTALGALGSLLVDPRRQPQRQNDEPVAVKADEPLPVELAPDGAGETE